jgi:hypothetical protein
MDLGVGLHLKRTGPADVSLARHLAPTTPERSALATTRAEI